MTRDWFRSQDWDERSRADFETRLARARPHSRQQYLRVKGVALRYAGNLDAACGLLQRAADYPRPPGHLHQALSAQEMLADIAAERGDRATAERLYRDLLALENASGTTGWVEISLAELLLDSGDATDPAEASGLLTSWMGRSGLKFDHDLFRWHLAVIRVAQAVGDTATVQGSASTALRLAERGPALPRHPDVGLIRTDAATLKRLRELAAP